MEQWYLFLWQSELHTFSWGRTLGCFLCSSYNQSCCGCACTSLLMDVHSVLSGLQPGLELLGLKVLFIFLLNFGRYCQRAACSHEQHVRSDRSTSSLKPKGIVAIHLGMQRHLTFVSLCISLVWLMWRSRAPFHTLTGHQDIFLKEVSVHVFASF